MTLSSRDVRAPASSSLLGLMVRIPSSSVTIEMDSSGFARHLDGWGMKLLMKAIHSLKVSSNFHLIWEERMQSILRRTLCNADFRYTGTSSVKKLKVSASLSVTSAITKALQSLWSSALTSSRWCSMWVTNSPSWKRRPSGSTAFLWPPRSLLRAGSRSVVARPLTVSRSWCCWTWSWYRSQMSRVIVRTFTPLLPNPSISSANCHACNSSWWKSTRPLAGTGGGRNFWRTSSKWWPSSM
mmetsp:Transcript_33597/g.89037  ORF Transcript_33597/g.89037 Transcript_33597/m.89037 type:complete len:240 (+) Transcript_33597:1786-2505(+)